MAERNIATPVAMSTIEKTRLRISPLARAAILAPSHAAAACAGAMQAQIARSMLPSWGGLEECVAIAATTVAGMLTTMPFAAARPTLLCMGSPDSVMTTFVRMPPPTPANPEQAPIPMLAQCRKMPPGGASSAGAKRSGNANLYAKIRQRPAKTVSSTFPSRCGATICAAATPSTMPGPHSFGNLRSAWPDCKCRAKDTTEAGTMEARDVATRDVCSVVWRCAGGGKSVVHGGYDHYTAADPDQSGTQTRAKSGQHPQSNQLGDTHGAPRSLESPTRDVVRRSRREIAGAAHRHNVLDLRC